MGAPPNSIWIDETTHFPRPGIAVLIVEDLVSRTWITEIVSRQETSTQVDLAFTAALDLEGLLDAVDARQDDGPAAGLVDLTIDDQTRPILLAVCDNGPQMTSGSTREYLALSARSFRPTGRCDACPRVRPQAADRRTWIRLDGGGRAVAGWAVPGGCARSADVGPSQVTRAGLRRTGC